MYDRSGKPLSGHAHMVFILVTLSPKSGPPSLGWQTSTIHGVLTVCAAPGCEKTATTNKVAIVENIAGIVLCNDLSPRSRKKLFATGIVKTPLAS
jgi:hypothetical protein